VKEPGEVTFTFPHGTEVTVDADGNVIDLFSPRELELAEEDLKETGEPGSRTCPECRGRCEDKYGRPCDGCFGEGEI
jgi:hypothetical protein